MFILMWFSEVPYLFPHPFHEFEGIKNLANEISQICDGIKQLVGFKGKSANEIEKTMLVEFRINWIKSVISIIVGIISGCLFLQRRRSGYFLTFFLSLLFISIRVIYLFKHPRLSFSLEYYKFKLQHLPVRTIHDFLIQLILLITAISIIYLFRTRNSGCFKKNP